MFVNTTTKHAEALALRALASGAPVRHDHPRSLEVDYHGSCLSPAQLLVTGRPFLREHYVWGADMLGQRRLRPKLKKHGSIPWDGLPMFLTMQVRCRKCDKCMAARGYMWSERAIQETLEAQRTWFCTFTLRPEEQYKALCEARRLNPDFDKLSEDRQFALRHAAISKEVTLYLKRVRKASGAKLRLLLVCERHKSGLPHYHALVHELAGSPPVLYRHLTDNWRLGYSKCKLFDSSELYTERTPREIARYVCKYLSKDARARVRASLHYGKTRANPTVATSDNVKKDLKTRETEDEPKVSPPPRLGVQGAEPNATNSEWAFNCYGISSCLPEYGGLSKPVLRPLAGEPKHCAGESEQRAASGRASWTLELRAVCPGLEVGPTALARRALDACRAIASYGGVAWLRQDNDVPPIIQDG